MYAEQGGIAFGTSVRGGLTLALLLVSLLFPCLLPAQAPNPDSTVDPTDAILASPRPEGRPVLPETVDGRAQRTDNGTEELLVEEEGLGRSFRAIVLGMDYDSLTQALSTDPLFIFRGERDVSLLPHRDQTLVEASGNSFVRKAWFQLHEGKLFIISLNLSPEHIDHYSMFTRLVERYGEPDTLNPRLAVWEDEDTRISLERPLTVKFIDRGIFNELQEEARVLEADITRRRREFLDEF